MIQKLLPLTLALFIVGCAPSTQMMPPDNCQYNSNININLNKDPIEAKPETRCAKPGDKITVIITPGSTAKETVATLAKGKNPDGGGPVNWLTEGNFSTGHKFVIEVPDKDYFDGLCDLTETCTTNCCDFDYSIFVKGRNMVDPRVTVKE